MMINVGRRVFEPAVNNKWVAQNQPVHNKQKQDTKRQENSFELEWQKILWQ